MTSVEITDMGSGWDWEDRQGEPSESCLGSGRHRKGLAGVRIASEKLQLSNVVGPGSGSTCL